MNRALRLLLLLAAIVVPARAEPDPTTPEAALEACRNLVESRKWSEAAGAYRRLLLDWPEAPALRAALADIVDDLKRVHYRLAVPPPAGKDLYGAAVTSFAEGTRKIELHWPGVPAGAEWEEAPGPLWALLIRFKDRVTVSFRFPDESVAVLLCLSIEKKGGYVVVPNHFVARDDPGESVTSIQRMDEGQVTILAKGPAFSVPPGAAPAFPKRFEVRRDMSAITVWGDRRGLLKIGDARYRGGYVGFLTARPSDVRVEGIVDETFHRQKSGEFEDARFRKWQAEEWRPEEVLPAWTRTRPAAGTAPPPPALPDDRDERKLDPTAAAALVSRCLEGDAEAAARLLSAASAQPGTTRLYLSAVAILAAGRLKDAEAGLTAVLTSAPAFAPARAIRGLVRLNLRRTEEARADLLEARRLAPGLETAWVGLLRLALLEGDLEAASRTLDEADASGAGGGRLAEFRGLVQRARRGPLWPKPYEAPAEHFLVRTDHSEELGRDVARRLEDALAVYAKRFPAERIPARRSRVWLFASEPGYHAYAGDLGRDLRGSAGIYDASLRELVLFLPADRTRFIHTVRHEGFHRFMHDFLDAPPPWFAEGCAEYFSSGRDLSGGAFATGRPIPEYVALLTGQTVELTMYRDLFLLDSAAFMANPGPHYAQSWAAVHFLLEAKDGALSKVFADYWAALREGLSTAEAFEKVLAPVADRIERDLPGYLRSLRE